jgi:hypothetical protein
MTIQKSFNGESGKFTKTVSQSYKNNIGFKGQVHSRVIEGVTEYCATTCGDGSTFNTFKQAEKFMNKLGYFKI